MALSKWLGIKTTAEISSRTVFGGNILLVAENGRAVTIRLSDWNTYGLKTRIGG